MLCEFSFLESVGIKRFGSLGLVEEIVGKVIEAPCFLEELLDCEHASMGWRVASDVWGQFETR